MKRHFLTALAVANLFSRLCVADGGEQTFDFDGHARTFSTFAPDPPPSQSAPLLVLLHGSTGNGASMIAAWRAEAERAGIVLVAPDALDKRAWQLPTDGPRFIRAIVQLMTARYPVDASRIYLFGHSGGAVYALTLSMLESQLFAATAVHAGAWRSSAEYRVVPLAVRRIPIVIFIGDRDAYFPLNAARRTQRALRSSGHEADLRVLTGHDHDYFAVAASINRQSWEFFAKSRVDGTGPRNEPPTE